MFTVGKIELNTGLNKEVYRDEYQVLLETYPLSNITYSILKANAGTYKFIEDNNNNGLFFKYKLEQTEHNIDASLAIKVYPDCLDDTTCYCIDFKNSLVKIVKK